MTDDGLTTGALFLGGGVAGYALGRAVLARWLDKKRAATAAGSTPTAPTAAPTPTTAPTSAPPAPPAQARTSPTPTRPPARPADPIVAPMEPDVGPVSSPAQVDPVATGAPVAVSTGSAEYDRRAARLIASIPKRVERTRVLIAQWPTFLDRYRGGLPRGVFAAVMQMESDGRPATKGDASLGEVGLFQITESFPRSLGLDPQLRYRNEWNFYFAGTEYNRAASRWHQRYPDLIPNGSRDAWLLARLSFAIGDGGARAHVKRAIAAEPERALLHGVYAALTALVSKGSARKAGSQSAAKVAYRIAVAVPTNFEIGERAEPGRYGAPAKLAPPIT